MFDFMREPLIPFRRPGCGVEHGGLPEVLAGLSGAEIMEFPGLTVHQRQPWYQFLVQLAAIALDRAGQSRPPADAGAWHRLLSALTPGQLDCAWSLVTEDPARPALLQPPVPEGGLEGFSGIGDTPDAIDVLITAKDHDLKQARMGGALPYHWLYALVSLQTSQGFLGAGNYGIARMNGGFSSRIQLDSVPGLGWGERFRSGVALLLDRRGAVSGSHGFAPGNGLALLWLVPWDGEAALELAELHPHFIEVCRRVRLVANGVGGAVCALGRTTRGPRINARQRKGVVGDSWMPVDRKAEAALTIGAGGFHYRRLAEILCDPAIEPPAALRPREGMVTLHAQVLVRGQGRTEGIYERSLSLPREQRDAFVCRDHPKRVRLHQTSQRMLDTVSGVKRALRLGLVVLLQGGFPADPGRRLKLDDRRPDPWLEMLDRRIDGQFFEHLWRLAAALPRGDECQRLEAAWHQVLAREAEAVFSAALAELPAPLARRERAQAHAEAAFHSQLRKLLDRGHDSGLDHEAAA